MSRLAERRDADTLYPRTFALYISPLRALGYDVEHNVRGPMRVMGLLERPNTPRAQLRRGRIRERYARTGVRTGDTPQEERRLMLARPPHILITTPESLALLQAGGPESGAEDESVDRQRQDYCADSQGPKQSKRRRVTSREALFGGLVDHGVELCERHRQVLGRQSFLVAGPGR